jgi:predicted nucleic acid-binding Zn ribbon protein
MRVEVISATVQKFNGENYWYCGKYFQRHGKRLHRAVWKYHHGEIPKKYHVHHVDEDRSNNQIENLQLLEGSNHEGHHGKVDDRTTWKSAMRDGAKKWHASEEGRQFHREHYEKHCKVALQQKKELVCDFCGKTYIGAGGRFCSGNCKSSWRRANNVDVIEFKCPICGSIKTVNKYTHGKTCSRKCGAILRRTKSSLDN